jgi:hypothetical protein
MSRGLATIVPCADPRRSRIHEPDIGVLLKSKRIFFIWNETRQEQSRIRFEIGKHPAGDV